MKKLHVWVLALVAGVGSLGSCQMRNEAEEESLQVIGEHEQLVPEAGYRLNLSYFGPLSGRQRFMAWADSLQKVMPHMVLTNESMNIMNYMPEQMGQEQIKPGMFQSNVSYNILVPDSATYGRITRDALRHNFPFNVNVTGTFVDPGKRQELQRKLMQQALENAKAKLDFLSGGRSYEIIGVEELDTNQPYGPEYYEFNRKMAARIKVKARLD